MIKAIVVSDTHGKQNWMKQIIKDENPFEVLIHAGDMEDRAEDVLGITDYSVHIVKGNCDYGYDCPMEKIFHLGGRTVLLLHGFACGGMRMSPCNVEYMVSYARQKGCDMLIYGHTHVPDYEVLEDGFIVLNPGSLTLPRQFDREKTYAVLTIEDKKVTVEQRHI